MALRSTQLSTPFLALLIASLVLSFLTGLGLWYVHEQREHLGELPRWTALCQTLHGVCNPVLCLLFGSLWSSHIRGGWKMKANRRSGGTLTALMIVLIATGVGLYYAEARHLYFSIHLAAGLVLGVALPVHWWQGMRWARRPRAEAEG